MEAGLLICANGGNSMGFLGQPDMSEPACCEYRPCVNGDAGMGAILFWIGSAGASKNAQRVGECAKTIAAF